MLKKNALYIKMLTYEKIVIFIRGLSNTEWVASFITAATLLPVLIIFHAAYTQH